MSVEQDLYELSKSSTISQHSSFLNLPAFGRLGNPFLARRAGREAGVRVAVKADRRAASAQPFERLRSRSPCYCSIEQFFRVFDSLPEDFGLFLQGDSDD